MTEQTATEAPRCRVGSATGNHCPRVATVNAWGRGGPDICEYHDRLWDLTHALGEVEQARFWLGSWERQAEELGCVPLEEAMRFIRAETDLEISRLRREISEVEGKE